MSDPYGGYEGYCEYNGIYHYKVISEFGILKFVTPEEALACSRGINMCGFKSEVKTNKS